MRHKKGFTLAEVLITLVIIGVIAAMTVPSLINKTQNQEFVSRLKKNYSTFAQATNLIIAEKGTPRGDKGGWANSVDNIYDSYRKYLHNAKECGKEAGCFEGQRVQNYKYLRGDDYTADWNTASYRKLILSDGVQVMFEPPKQACDAAFNGSLNYCAAIWFDLNGERKPNIFGRDLFLFVLKENGLYPAGCDKEEPSCDKTTSGKGCACKVLREGAMNY